MTPFGELAENARVTFSWASGVVSNDDEVIVPGDETVTADDAGAIDVDLEPGPWTLRLRSARGVFAEAIEITVPEAASADIAALVAEVAPGTVANRVRQFATRPDLEDWIDAGNVPVDGYTYFADGLSYLGQTGATAIDGLPGLIYAPEQPATTEAIAARITLAELGGRIVFLGSDGYPALVIEPDGNILNPHIQEIEVGANVAVALAEVATPSLAQSLVVAGSDGYAGLTYRDGVLTVGEVVEVGPFLGSGFRAEINHVMVYGQSLAVGSQGVPPISTTDVPGSLRFVGGVRAQDAGTDPAVKYASLVAHVETTSSLLGETVLAGAVETFGAFWLDDDGVDIATAPQQFLVSAPGQGGTNVAELSSGTTFYNRALDDITYGKALAAADDMTYAPAAFAWIQGHADQGGGTQFYIYQNAVRAIFDGFTAHARTVTGDAGLAVPVFLTQLTGHTVTANPDYPTIALAQLDLAERLPGYVMACPMYQFPYNDAAHMTAAGYKWAGAYLGRAMKRWLIDKQKFRPLVMASARRQALSGTATAIIVEYRADFPITIDTSAVSDDGTKGFRVRTSGGTPVTISSVSQIGPKLLKIVCATDPGVRARLSYAFGDGDETGSGPTIGARGCVRDTCPDETVIDGDTYSLANWAMVQEVETN